MLHTVYLCIFFRCHSGNAKSTSTFILQTIIFFALTRRESKNVDKYYKTLNENEKEQLEKDMKEWSEMLDQGDIND